MWWREWREDGFGADAYFLQTWGGGSGATPGAGFVCGTGSTGVRSRAARGLSTLPRPSCTLGTGAGSQGRLLSRYQATAAPTLTARRAAGLIPGAPVLSPPLPQPLALTDRSGRSLLSPGLIHPYALATSNFASSALMALCV